MFTSTIRATLISEVGDTCWLVKSTARNGKKRRSRLRVELQPGKTIADSGFEHRGDWIARGALNLPGGAIARKDFWFDGHRQLPRKSRLGQRAAIGTSRIIEAVQDGGASFL